MKTSGIIIGLIFTFFISCNPGKSIDNTFIFKVARTDFLNAVQVSGVIEAKKSASIVCPDVWPQPKVNTLVDEGTIVKKGDIVCTLDAAQVTNNYKEALNVMESSRTEYNKTEANLRLTYALLESKVKSVEASLSIANLQLARLEYVSPIRKKIIELQIKRSEIEKEKIEKKLKSLEFVQESELKGMRLKMKKAENKVNRAKMFLDRLTLKASSDGVLIHAMNWMTGEKMKEGDALWGGMPIVQIPETSVLQVKLKADETNVRKIKNGQIVNAFVDARPDLKLTGKVTHVASMGKPIKKGSKIKTFEIVVELDSTDLDIAPGMASTCEIIVESISDTLVIPRECVIEKDSLEIVYVRENSKFVRRQVSVGSMGDNFVVITDGIKQGDEVSIIEPPQQLVKSEKQRES